jgi:hypothetical protein
MTILQKVILSLMLVSGITVKGQTYFWTEDFSSSTCLTGCTLPYTGTNGTWIWAANGANGTKANTWYISDAEEGLGRGLCGTSGADPSLHIGNVKGSPLSSFFCPNGDCGAAYDAGFGTGKVVTNAMAQSPVINCTGESTITLSFNYIMDGQNGKDYGSVWYNTGSGWALLVNMTKSGNCTNGQGHWTHYSVAMPASANNNASVQIGFNWTNNDDGAGTDPSFAIDSIQLSVPVILPIQLLSFNATYDDNENVVNLDWATATETNNGFFTIERTTNGEEYSRVTTVKGAGNSSVTRQYFATDAYPNEGQSYYRLKQTDYDGHFTYSAPVAVNVENTNVLKIYPNPAGNWLNLSWYSFTTGTSVISICDNTGRILMTPYKESTLSQNNTHSFSIASLSPGLYFIRLEDPDGKLIIGKFVKQ